MVFIPLLYNKKGLCSCTERPLVDIQIFKGFQPLCPIHMFIRKRKSNSGVAAIIVSILDILSLIIAAKIN
jgi:hypothetical protein